MRRYVALGDSMSIDDYAGGPGRGAASLLHRNLDTDFPDWAGRDLAANGWSVDVAARDGAVTADVLDRQLPHLNGGPDLATLTVGGNDLLTAYGDDTAAAAVIGRVAAQAEAILIRLPRTCRVVVTTVYDPSDGTGTAPGLTPWPMAPHWIRTLNNTLTDVAARHGAILADVHAAFTGHGVTAGNPAQTDARPANRDLWFCGVIEPNAWGAHAIRATWWNALAEAADSPLIPGPGPGPRSGN
ncbi:SGNH/GDSL hydrolase family protein [Actinoplanes sp. CA-252034]|uniref:SGNH/GDSL hydrolase family protein n=1 Tax=Actinoplanes sp. CA-252034 TaxID=3239906 RepID=UPI003D963F8E